jgi:hypothetical protein
MICEKCNEQILHPDHICNYAPLAIQMLVPGKIQRREKLEFNFIRAAKAIAAWVFSFFFERVEE